MIRGTITIMTVNINNMIRGSAPLKKHDPPLLFNLDHDPGERSWICFISHFLISVIFHHFYHSDKMGPVGFLSFHCCLSSKPTVPHGWWTILMIIVIIMNVIVIAMTLKYMYWAATNSDLPHLAIFSNPFNFDSWHIVFRWSHVGSQWDGQVLLKIGTSKRTFRGFCVLVRTITHFVSEFLMLLSMSRY